MHIFLHACTHSHLLLKVAAAAVTVMGLFAAISESSKASSLPGLQASSAEGPDRALAATGELPASQAGNKALHSKLIDGNDETTKREPIRAC